MYDVTLNILTETKASLESNNFKCKLKLFHSSNDTYICAQLCRPANTYMHDDTHKLPIKSVK